MKKEKRPIEKMWDADDEERGFVMCEDEMPGEVKANMERLKKENKRLEMAHEALLDISQGHCEDAREFATEAILKILRYGRE